MAKVSDNIVTTGLSGMLGNQIVFRSRGGNTYVSKAPKKPTERTEAQKAHNLKFQEAVLYAKNAISDEITKELYQASATDEKTAYNIAVADFFNAPQITDVDLANYNGQIGSYIQVRATDDFDVVAVSVTIQNADGSIVESGNAALQPGSSWWRYTATTTNESLEGDKITVRATDIPGNHADMEKAI